MWLGDTGGVTIAALGACSVSCSNAAKEQGPPPPVCPQILAFVLVDPLCFWKGPRQSGEQRERHGPPPRAPSGGPRGSEASGFGRRLIERDDEAGEAFGPVASCGFGLCSPADFAVSVKRLLGRHQSRSS